MKASMFFAVVLLAAVSILLSCTKEVSDENAASLMQAQQAGEFLNYIPPFNELWESGTPTDGDASGRVALPTWLPRNSLIQLRISGGVGYIYMPSFPGLYATLLQETENSTHFGLSDAAGINTPAGRLTRPDFIPSGYVVYVR